MKTFYPKLCVSSIVMLLSATTGYSQEYVEMADLMRSEGKIYVVVVVASIVLLGILIYLISIDRKVSKLEKEIKNQQKSK